MKKCVVCGNDSGSKKVCSDTCNKALRARLARESRLKNLKPKEDRHCLFCSTLIPIHAHHNKTYCSEICQTADAQKRKLEENKTQFSNMDMPTCRICGWKSENLISHVSQVHGLSSAEYQAKFELTKSDVVSAAHSELIRERVSGDKNPWAKHGGKLSPFSEKFSQYSDLTEEEKKEKIIDTSLKASSTRAENGNDTTTAEYYVKRGMSEEEAEDALAKRQTTFSLETCIEKHGAEEGLLVWKARQEKWQNTLTSKSQEEIDGINKKKKIGCVSKTSQELFENFKFDGERFSNKNGELRILLNSGRHVSFDYALRNKVIEFYGDVWHANPAMFDADDMPLKFVNRSVTAQEIQQKDAKRTAEIKELGYEVLVVWESEYRKNKEKVIEECSTYLNC